MAKNKHPMAKNKHPQVANRLNLDPRRFHPLGEQLLIEVELEHETPAGIIIPQAAQLQAQALPVGRVREVGPEVKRLQAGDRVLVRPMDPTTSKIDTLLWLVPESKCFAKVDPKAEPVIQSVG